MNKHLRSAAPVLVAAVTAALLSGCAVGPRYKRPEVQVPTQFTEGQSAYDAAHPPA
jgi:uncharacterized lipoprotein